MKPTNFATLEGQELVSELNTRVDSFVDYRRQNREPLWSHNERLYYNRQFRDANNPTGITYDGERGELTLVGVNHLRNLITHTINLIIGVKPSFNARATNSDARSLAQAKLANALMDYYHKEKDLTNILKRALEEALVRDAGYIAVTWDPSGGQQFAISPEGNPLQEGDVLFRNLSAYEVIFDQNKTDFNDNDWVMTYQMRSRFELAAEFPDMAEDILKLETGKKDGTNGSFAVDKTSGVDSDDIQVFEFYHRWTAALPTGRYVMFAGDLILYSAESPYAKLPVYQITGGRDLNTQFGYSTINDLVPLQEMLNAHYSAINSNHEAFGTQKIAVARGANVIPEEVSKSLTLVHFDADGGPAPQPLNLCQTPAEMFNMLDKINNDMENLSGINSVVRGEATQGVTSGTALALLQNQSIQFASHLQEGYVKLCEDVATATIRLLRSYAQSPRIVAIAGKHNKAAMQEFVGDDLATVDRVVVELGNPMARTTAGRVELANQLTQTGLIQTPEQYLQVIDTGNLEVLTENSTGQLQLIKEENELLMEGQQQPVMITDDHRLHILEHRAILDNPEIRRDQALVQLVEDHIWQHINNLNNPAVQQLHMLLNHQGAMPGMPPMGPGGQPMGPMPSAVDPASLGAPGQVGVAPGAAPANLPQPAQPPAQAQQPGNPLQMGPGPV